MADPGPEDSPENSAEDLFGAPEKDSLPPARNQAMNWLARREHAQAELRTKLAARNYSDEAIDAAISSLVADGLVCDERFAESFIAARMRKGQGPVRIRMELSRRGVDSETIRLHLDEAGLNWIELAREVRSRKFAGAVPEDFRDKARQMRFLEYRGFTSGQINAAMKDESTPDEF